jgi:phosphomannomutase
MLTQIKFGTSGWRAVMAEEFTFANVRRAVGGIARYVVSQKPQGARVIVGRDPRFLGETFCAMAAEILAAHGITPLVVAEPVPTPAFAHAVVHNKADGIINFTASHNPPEYNGIKFSTPDGYPALPEVTKKIEAEIVAGDNSDSAKGRPPAPAKLTSAQYGALDPKPSYLKRLGEIIDLGAIRKANLRVVFDPMWARLADTLTNCCAAPGCTWPRCTITVTFCSVDTPRNPTTICWKICEKRCARLEPTSVLRPTATPTASVLSTPTAPFCSRIM